MARRNELLPDPKLSDAVLLMVGAAFSLWRAIFLTYTTKTLTENFENGERFLRRIVRHNTIAYGDDVKRQAWSFGYYLNNWKFRLKPILIYLDLYPDDIEWLEEPLPISADAQTEWTRHCDVLERALTALTERLATTA